MHDHKQLFLRQSASWSLAAENYRALSGLLFREFLIDGFRIRLQFNPGRIVSSSANVSRDAIQARPCFLCAGNRPDVQEFLSFTEEVNPNPGTGLDILVNPFPVFPQHFTIAAREHRPQAIKGQFGSMLDLAKAMDDCVVFYNGPKCGASAPDHLHFQAGSKGHMPIESDFAQWEKTNCSLLMEYEGIRLSSLQGFLRYGWLLEGANRDGFIHCLEQLLAVLESVNPAWDEEPMLNLLCWYGDGKWLCTVFPRKAHRPACYFREDEHKLLISPASVEMGGLMVAARQEDFERIGEAEIREIYNDVSLSKTETDRLSIQFTDALKNNI